ncbi:MAG: RNA-binding protein Hfq [Alphaproteobacteria bacterium ADurb.Bin438]|nr:MAG: RNA-binding protein Hfq [Alphaproteobacteria bacterium ADurb.Bin438]
MNEKNFTNNSQDVFLNTLKKNKIPVTIYLVMGIKLQGIITSFDTFTIILRRDGLSQMIYKNSISTILPSIPMPGFDNDGE